MISKYKKYANYKDSGVDWLGEVPEHWEVKKSKHIWVEKIDLSEYGDEQLLSVSQYTGVGVNLSESRGSTLVGYKRVNNGDLVINIMLAWLGGLGLSSEDGIVSPAYAVYYLKKDSHARFLHYLYRTDLYLSEFARRSKGVVPSRWRMYTEDFGQVITLLPPLHEQQLIANFLDEKTADIDKAISQKEQMIKLLNERKQIVINNAVTRGLNPDVKFKDSGIDWIGEIPEHWEVRKLKYLVKITTGDKNTEDNVENGMYDFYVRSPNVERINSFTYDGEGILTAGDGVGVGRVFHYVNGKFDFHQRVYLLFDFNNEMVAKFLYSYLKGFLIIELMRYNAKSTVDSVRLPVLKNFQVPIPPLSEQQEISDYIEQQTSKISTAIALIEQEISLLKEYKASLIDSAVRGKICLV